MPSLLLPEITLPAPAPVPPIVLFDAAVDHHAVAVARTGGRSVDVRTQKITRDQITVCLNMDSGTARKVVNVQPYNRAAGRAGSANRWTRWRGPQDQAVAR